ncbi:MAG: hypothetical protein ABIH03_14140 [Pseudomonadota bacterium]
MANLGPRDTSLLVMLTGWDATALQNFQLQDGTSYAEVVARMSAALAGLNAEFAGDWMATLYSVTDEPDTEYRVGSSNGFEDHTEYGRPDAKRAATEGHMLPLKGYDRMLGWTWDYLRDARLPQIEADIADAIKDARDKRRQRLLRRLLKRGDDSGAGLGLGSTGYSPGFATAAVSTSVDFTPPAYSGTSFDSDHEHYVGITGSVFTNAVFSDAKDELREHGHEPPYNFIIGPSDETNVRALSNFTPVPELLVRYGSTQDLASLGVGEIGTGAYPIGTISDFAIYVIRGVPQYYGFGWRPYGRLSQRNPLRVRLYKGSAVWQVVAMTDPHSPNGMLPVQNLMLFLEFGVGIYDRTNGTARYTVSETWADGTAT